MGGKKRNIFFALAQGRQVHRDDVKAIEKIFTKLALLHSFTEVDVGCSNDADIDLNLVRTAELHELLVL